MKCLLTICKTRSNENSSTKKNASPSFPPFSEYVLSKELHHS